MTTSTNAIICYGITFPDEYQFPWDTDELTGEDAIKDWWLYKICGYTDPFELYNTEGNWLDGQCPPDERVSEYFQTQRDFLKEHPVPVSLVCHCSGEYPMWIVTAPGTIITAYRGEPKIITSHYATRQHYQLLIEFCSRYCQPLNEYDKMPKLAPQWYLSSFWG